MEINFEMLSDTKVLILTVITVVISYMIGSINFAIILSKIFKKDDVRKYGSGNAGMTNMLRIYGILPAALTAIGDFSKGLISIFIAKFIFTLAGVSDFNPSYFCAFAALLGHLYPVFFGFRGGKGVLTIFGISLYFTPILFLLLFAIYVPMAFITRIVSLASVLGLISYPICVIATNLISGNFDYQAIVFSIIIVILPLYAHRENIKRLLKGTENKFGSKPKE
ncbi:MAG: glycerol-3-phosphate 1-O-acyltransferase PlsY [Oscillospiraceae bacterium]